MLSLVSEMLSFVATHRMRRDIRRDKSDAMSPSKLQHMCLMEGVPEDGGPISRPRKAGTPVRRVSVSPLIISDQLPPQRRQSFRLPDNALFLRQSSEESRAKGLHQQRGGARSSVHYTSLTSQEKVMSPERREEKRQGAESVQSPIPLHTLLPPIDKHTSDNCLSQTMTTSQNRYF